LEFGAWDLEFARQTEIPKTRTFCPWLAGFRNISEQEIQMRLPCAAAPIILSFSNHSCYVAANLAKEESVPMSTRAIQYLKQKGVPYCVAEYKHLEKGAKFAAQALGMPLEKTIKTLVVDLGRKGHILALMPGDKELSLKKLSRILSVKHVEMVDPATAERLTGYTVGGISPFGTQRKLPVIMDKCLLKFNAVAVNGGKRGVMLILKPHDIVRAANVTIGEIAE
jgi:Cys-tRNA(Pro) deacylase